MKSHTCVPVVAVLVVILVMAVQEVQLISPLGRRFGRSLNKKYSPGRPLRPQVQYYRQQTFPQIENENGEGQHFYEWVSILWYNIKESTITQYQKYLRQGMLTLTASLHLGA